MHATLLYLDPDHSERQEMVQLAADLVEALTFQFKEHALLHQTIGVVAEPSVCLEIGFSMLGRGETRTVEGGKRQKSPLILFPFISKSNETEMEFSLMGGFNKQRHEWHDEFGTLNDLAMYGAVEQDDFHSNEWLDLQPSTVLKRALHSRKWQRVLVFGAKEFDFEHESLLKHCDAKVERVSRYYRENERLHGLLERLDPVKDETIYQVQREAVTSALEFEDLLNRFETQEKFMNGAGY